MAYSTAGLNAAVDGIATAGTYISAHTGDPGTTGTNEVTGGSYARAQTTWGSASGGNRVGSQVDIAIPGGTEVTHWGLYSAASSGTFLYGGALEDGPEGFGADGTLKHTPTLTVQNPA